MNKSKSESKKELLKKAIEMQSVLQKNADYAVSLFIQAAKEKDYMKVSALKKLGIGPIKNVEDYLKGKGFTLHTKEVGGEILISKSQVIIAEALMIFDKIKEMNLEMDRLIAHIQSLSDEKPN